MDITQHTPRHLSAVGVAPEPTLLDVKQTAAAMRKALAAAFLGVKFSVRMSRGTGYGWLDVSWQDGPTVPPVKAVVRRFESERWSGMDDSYHQVSQTGPVRYSCCGVITRRTMSAEGMDQLAALINEAAGECVARVEPSPWGCAPRIVGDSVPVEAARRLDVRNHFERNGQAEAPVPVDLAAHQLFSRMDFAAPEVVAL